jgi:hypothetical protein
LAATFSINCCFVILFEFSGLRGEACSASRSRRAPSPPFSLLGLSARFVVTAPAQVKTREYTLRDVVTSPSRGSEKFENGYQVTEYPHIERRQAIGRLDLVFRVRTVIMRKCDPESM